MKGPTCRRTTSCSSTEPCSAEPANPARVRRGGQRRPHLRSRARGRGDRLIGASTRVIDLEGALLAPGFQDAHIHPVGAGVELLQCNLTEATDAAAAVAAVAAYAQPTPRSRGSSGGGWSMDHFPGGAPLRGLLDAVVPDRPVLVQSRDHHSAWANSAAIRGGGNRRHDARSGRRPNRARSRRDTRRHLPRGCDGAVRRRPSELSADLAYQGLLRAQSELVALGITGWQDAMVGSVSGVPDPLGAYSARSTRERSSCGWSERSGGSVPAASTRSSASLPGATSSPRGGDRLRAGHRQDHGRRRRREPDGRDAHAVPGPPRPRHPQQRDVVRRPRAAARVRDGAGCRGHAGALPRPGRPGRARGARCRRGGPAKRTARPMGAITSRICRSSTKRTCRASPTSTRSPTSRRSGRRTKTSSTS